VTYGRGKSDSPIVPKKPPNNGGCAPSSAGGAEGRGLAKGNPSQQSKSRTQCRTGVDRARPTRARSGKPPRQPRDCAYVRSADLSHALERIRQAAAQDSEQRFTALWHHVYNVDRLREGYFNLKPHAAPGVDGQTWQEYGESLEARLQDLSERLRRGAYRARPVRRVYIPKADGRQRPIGVPALEDKLVQRAATASPRPSTSSASRTCAGRRGRESSSWCGARCGSECDGRWRRSRKVFVGGSITPS